MNGLKDRVQHTTSLQNLGMDANLYNGAKSAVATDNFYISSKLFSSFVFVHNFTLLFHVHIKYAHYDY